jgi:hypothetical protein
MEYLLEPLIPAALFAALCLFTLVQLTEVR